MAKKSNKLKLNILVIDADPAVARVFDEVKGKTGDAVEIVAGEPALKKTLSSVKRDAVFTALLGKDRNAFLQRLVKHKELRAVPIVVLAEPDDLSLGITLDCLFKPIDADSLLAAIERVREAKNKDPLPAEDPRETLALDLFHQERYAESLKLFLLLAKENNQGKNWMNVANTCAMMGDADGAEAAMKKAIPLQTKMLRNTPALQGADLVDILTPAFMVYYLVRSLCAGGQAARAVPWLNKLRKYYENRSTDTHLLVSGGLPVLRQVIEAIDDVSRGAGPAFKTVAWVRSFQKTLDPEGQDALDEFLKGKGK